MSGNTLGVDQGALHTQEVHAIRQYLAWCHCWEFKVHGGGFQRKGIPDILACFPPDGRLLGIEVKTGAAVCNDNQKRELENIRQAGGLALVAHSVEELEQFLIKHELLTEPLVTGRLDAMRWRMARRAGDSEPARLAPLERPPVE